MSLKTGWTQAYLILLYFTLFYLADTAFFYTFKVCGSPASSKSFSTIFPTVFAHFTSLCFILVILAVFQTFSLLFYLLWWSVIFDVTIVIVLGCHEPHTYKTANLIINVVCVLTAPLTGHSHISLPLLRPPYSLRHNNVQIRPVNNPAMVSKCSSERKSQIKS